MIPALSTGAIAGPRGGGGGGTHRYWEFYPIAASGTAHQMAEIEMAETVGGADLTGGRTITTAFLYGEAAYLDPGNAFNNDGDTTRTNRSNQIGNTFGCTLRVDFGAPQTIREFRIQQGTPWNTNFLTAFAARGSNDLTNWTTYGIFTNISWASATEVKSFPLTPALLSSGRANARGWRLWFDVNNGGSFCVVSNLVLAATGGGAGFNTLANGNPGTSVNGGNAFGSRTTAVYDVRNYEKGMAGAADPVNQYWATEVTTNQFLGFVTSAPQNCVEARIISFGASSQINAPRDGKIEYTTDFVTWTSVTSWTGLTTGWNTGRTFSF